jgi:thiamine-phosphate pyrophosphorylase
VSPLYAIVDVEVCERAGRPAADLARDYLAGGLFLRLVDDVAAQARAVGATVIVNDRVDVAAAAGLGVHLGQDDLSVADARAVLGPGAIVGLSTHTPAQLASALRQPVSYVAFGPVFVTGTKANPDPVVGLRGVAIAALAATAAGVPLVAIGGITWP